MTQASGETAPETTSTSDPTSTDDRPETEATETESGNSEAAKYRRRLRDTESERDQLAERVQRMQRSQIERQIADQLSVPGDLFAFGLSVGDLLDDNGEPDEGLIATAVYGLLEQRPGLGKTAPRPKGPTITGHATPTGGGKGSWAELLQNPSNR